MTGQHLGWGWVCFRLRYWVKLRSRWLELACPTLRWGEVKLPVTDVSLEERPFFFKRSAFEAWRAQLLAWDDGTDESPVELAQDVREGRFRFYSWDEKSVGFPPKWHHNAYTDQVVPKGEHWSRLADFGFGDIKHVWELSRFGWVYSLVRAHARDGDAVHAETFERLLEDWLVENPPNLGPQWKCGQEVAIRLMAVLWGWFGLPGSPEMRESVRKLAWVSGKRIEANIEYAVQQYNNHGLSEAAGLWTLGLLFPEFEEAERWKERGRFLLESQASKLIYEDGGCSQSSFNYERVMLDVLGWSVRLGELHEEPLDKCVSTAMAEAVELLWQCQDDASGQLPNYGANDGALFLPLANADYTDFRPSVQLASVVAGGLRRYVTGAHDEGLLWFFGEEGLGRPLSAAVREDFEAKDSGYFTLRSKHGFLFMRCGKFPHRPSHADQLHVDLWWRGKNVLVDSGTYSYNAAKPFDEGFKGTRFHNTVRVDDCDQMDKASRFLWLPWSNGAMRECEDGVLFAEHDGYERLADPVSHRRVVMRVDDAGFLIVDHLRGERASHAFEVRWHLQSGANRQEDGSIVYDLGGDRFVVQMWCEHADWALGWECAEEGRAEGWLSRRYMEKERGHVLTGRVEGSAAVMVTWVGEETAAISAGDASGLKVEVGGRRRHVAAELFGR